jgi:HEAT repeat protein
MPQKTFNIVFILIFCTYYCTSSKLTEDAIQRDITSAVKDYNSDNWETRLKALKRISRYLNTVYAKNSFLLILIATEDPHSEIRIETLKILKAMKAPAAEERIRNIAVSDTNANVKYFAFSALEEYGNKNNEGAFLAGLKDNDWLVKEAALRGLMKINDPDIQKKHIQIIIKAINDKNISIRITALSNLSIRDPLIYTELTKIISNKDSSSTMLKAALNSIKGYKIDEITKAKIINLLTYNDQQVRILSLQVLKYKE